MPRRVQAEPAIDLTERHADAIRTANELIREAYRLLPFEQPVGCVQWVPMDCVHANDYNPNAVARQELDLLHTSISSDGYTQPVVTIADPEKIGHYIVVDGFHRTLVMKTHPDIAAMTGGYLPIVVIDKPLADRMAATIRHNRARGKHSIAGMGNLVFQMLMQGETDAEICAKFGLEAEELARLKHITGYSKLYANSEFSRPVLTSGQIKAKADYRKAHPDEPIPTDF